MLAPKRINERQPLEPIVLNTHAFDDVSLDVMGGPLPKTKKGNMYVPVSYTHLTLPTNREV